MTILYGILGADVATEGAREKAVHIDVITTLKDAEYLCNTIPIC